MKEIFFVLWVNGRNFGKTSIKIKKNKSARKEIEKKYMKEFGGNGVVEYDKKNSIVDVDYV